MLANSFFNPSLKTIPSMTTDFDLPKLKNILVVGSGGREHSIAWCLSKNKDLKEVFITPGNAGSQQQVNITSLAIAELDFKEILGVCLSKGIDLVVIGPEEPLARGLADKLRANDIAVFGPDAEGAKLEASKSWAKNLMRDSNIPTADFWEADSEKDAIKVIDEINQPMVVKADGLAAGKGVVIANSIDETKKAIRECFKGKHGSSGYKIVLEEILEGPEVSVFAMCDGNNFIVLPPAQDHKRLLEGDKGPNTGGMGAYAPAPLLNKYLLKEIENLIIKKTIKALQNKGIEYRGIIYAGLMLTKDGPKVIEFNCRFGDPECQVLMPLMGPEFAHVLQACALGCLEKAPELKIIDQKSVCIVAAANGYPEKPRKGDKISLKLNTEEGLQVFHAGTKKNDNDEFLTNGGRVLSVVTQAKNFDEAFSKAYKGIKNVDFDGIIYRKDIGHQIRSN
tara:strand:+ start:12002 stop:13354 length:1353 start_codon:yes stop_codon:yes gene_type:complete